VSGYFVQVAVHLTKALAESAKNCSLQKHKNPTDGVLFMLVVILAQYAQCLHDRISWQYLHRLNNKHQGYN